MKAYSQTKTAIKQRERYQGDPVHREKIREFNRKYYSEHRKELTREYRRRPNKRYLYTKRNAGYENKEFTLTEDQYTALISKPCHYCEGALSETGRGLDRIDNSRGYSIDNVLPCCTICNQTRNTFYTVEETKIMINALKEFRLKRAG